MSKNLTVACWSLGRHAQTNILPSLQKTSSVDLHGAFTRNSEVLQRKSEQFGCIAYDDEDQLLQDPQVEAVYISSPASEHYAQVRKCLEAHKSVLVEKTAFLELHEAEELIHIANERQLVIMEAFMYRFHKQFSTLRQILLEEDIGDPIKIDINFGFPHLERPNIRYDPTLAGGALYDAGAYTVSAARNLTSDDLSLQSACIFSERGFEVDTSGNALFIANNTTVSCAWAFGGAYRNDVSVWTPERNIYTSRIFSKPETYDTSIELIDSKGRAELRKIGRENHFVKMFEAFKEAIRNPSASQENSQLLNQAKVMHEIRSRASLR